MNTNPCEPRKPVVRISLFISLIFFCALGASSAAPQPATKFEISFPASLHKTPITGRVFLIISRNDNEEPRFRAGWWGDTPPIFGVDVSQLKPEQSATVDSGTLGYPAKSLRDIPAGDYYVQAVLNVYTQFHRADGHVIWAHMDHWEGQWFSRSPGNLYSQVRQVHLDPETGYDLKLSLAKVIPPIQVPQDTTWVKRLKIQSQLLSHFWGQPIHLGATVLLPKGFDEHPDVHYPVIYLQGHFSLRAPFGFRTPGSGDEESYEDRGAEFYNAWNSAGFPRMIVVTFQHPTPYFDDSYAVNSANNGPCGDAIMKELIPAVEERFRVIRQPYARLLTGGSTGGWESLALQLYHPAFFGGVWCFYPDPIDFRNYGLVDIYADDNAFRVPGRHWLVPERYIMRASDGQPEVTAREFSRLEAVLGSHGRSSQQLEAWEAVYCPVGADGYPKPVWNKLTGQIDHQVADYMRERGYDLRAYLSRNWPQIGPELVGKLHFYVGDMDNYYLNLAVYRMQDFLKNTSDPHYEGSFEYGRPMKGHGWSPMSNSQLVRAMAAFVKEHAPAVANTWNY
jgi:enterochelin esterase-like enzyme